MSSASVLSAAERGSALTASFSVHARAEPGVMPRVLELFAKRGLVPRKWHSTTAGADCSELTIDIQIGGLARDTVDYLAQCMRQIIGIEVVLTTQSPLAG